MTLLDKTEELLIAQRNGEVQATTEVRNILRSLWESYEDETLCDPELSNDQCYALLTLLKEWSAMFSFVPGRIEGLDSIIRLVAWIKGDPSSDSSGLYVRPEWKQIVELRGPVTTVLRVACNTCGSEYVSMGMSGFLDANAFICSDCGNVYFKSYYDESPLPSCGCGGQYVLGCPKCKNTERKIVSESSPYEYFAKHKFDKEKM
jgi:hypothetical protein